VDWNSLPLATRDNKERKGGKIAERKTEEKMEI
jgi:hypothetical protein